MKSANSLWKYKTSKIAEEVSAEFFRIHSEHKLPDKIPIIYAPSTIIINIVDLMFSMKLTTSKGEARRLVQQGAVKINNKKITDINTQINLSNENIIQIGKRKFAKIKIIK